MHGATPGLFSQRSSLQPSPPQKPCHANPIQCNNRSLSSFPYAPWVEMIPEGNNWSIYSRVGCAAYKYLCWRDFGFFFLVHWHFHPPFSMPFISVFGDIVWLGREKAQICWTHVFRQLSLCELACRLASSPCIADSYIILSENNYFCPIGKKGNSFLHK